MEENTVTDTIRSSAVAEPQTHATDNTENTENTDKDPRRWMALLFIALAQLMVVLDGTIMNIALPSAQRSLGFSDGSRQWLITGYTLAFGSLLLLGGRVADYTGRKRALLIGLTGFALASALGGAAPDFTVLLIARCLQGAFGALLAPAALSLLATTFTEPLERAKAFGLFGAVAVGGNAIGLLLGGLLTEYLNWRFCLYVNIPIAVIALLGGLREIRESRAEGPIKLDLPGVLLVVGGLVAIVYGLGQASTDGWGSGTVLGCLIGGAVLLAGFLVVESRVAAPLLPLRVLLSRTRGGAYLAVGVAAVGMFALFLFLTYYMQDVKNYSAVMTGVAFLPMTAAIMVSAVVLGSRLVPKVAPRMLMVPGMLIAAGGLALMTAVKPDTGYAIGVLPVEVLMGLGLGLVMAPAMNYATHGVRPDDTGVAPAMDNTSQPVLASVGIALANTVAASATTSYLKSHKPSRAVADDAVVHGFATASGVSAAIVLGGAVLVALLMNARKPDPSQASADGRKAIHI
jgi:EmrB/QacA subfamily drug resistance transporter